LLRKAITSGGDGAFVHDILQLHTRPPLVQLHADTAVRRSFSIADSDCISSLRRRQPRRHNRAHCPWNGVLYYAVHLPISASLRSATRAFPEEAQKKDNTLIKEQVMEYPVSAILTGSTWERRKNMHQKNKRHLLKTFSMLPFWGLSTRNAWSAPTEPAIDIAALKQGYMVRLKRLLAAGELPYIDIESSCNPNRIDIADFATNMDRLHVGLMAMSADIGKGMAGKKQFYHPLSSQLIAAYPDRFIPVGNGAQAPAFDDISDASSSPFMNAQEEAANAHQFLLLGEYEFRHYPSPREYKRGGTSREGAIPIDGAMGHRLFSFSEKSGLSFQIHYEIEDELLPPLEAMLAQYPKAKVIWCHVAQIRYLERASRYSPSYVESLIKRFPNLRWDTAFGDANSVYPASHQRHSRIWGNDGDLAPAWRDLIVAYPQRFLSALDLGGDRLNRFVEYDTRHRYFLSRLPPETRHQVAYRNAWALLFDEEFT
jgi:hypothetical protein